MRAFNQFLSQGKFRFLGAVAALFLGLQTPSVADDLFVDLVDSEIIISFLGPRNGDGILGVDLASQR